MGEFKKMIRARNGRKHVTPFSNPCWSRSRQVSGMRVLVIHNRDLTQSNAETTHVVEIAGHLAQAGLDVELISPEPVNPNICCQAKVRWIKTWGKSRILRLLSYNFNLLLYLLTKCYSCRSRIVYFVRSGMLLYSPFLVAKLYGIPLFVAVNGSTKELSMMYYIPTFLIRLVRFLSSMAYRSATAVITVTQGLKNELVELYHVKPDRIVIIPNAANIQLFRPIDRMEAMKRLELDPRFKYICFVGTFAPWQGLDVLLQAIEYLKGRNIRLLLVGDGRLRRSITELVKTKGLEDHVIIVGAVPYEQVPLYIGAAYLCVMPKVYDPSTGLSPMKLYEYLACARPVVATDIPEVTEVLSRGKCGRVVPIGDARALADAIEQLLGMCETEWTLMGLRGRSLVAKCHSWDAVASLIKALIREFA